MYELVSVLFPFADDRDKGKPRPGFVISPPFGTHKQVVIAYVTTRLDEIRVNRSHHLCVRTMKGYRNCILSSL